jgi:hypothetical protein
MIFEQPEPLRERISEVAKRRVDGKIEVFEDMSPFMSIEPAWTNNPNSGSSAPLTSRQANERLSSSRFMRRLTAGWGRASSVV